MVLCGVCVWAGIHGVSLKKLTSECMLQPQDAYGLEKLATEELCMHYDKDFGIECRIARFHNIYGPYGTWKGGREKAPAAFCRKVVIILRAARATPLFPSLDQVYPDEAALAPC